MPESTHRSSKRRTACLHPRGHHLEHCDTPQSRCIGGFLASVGVRRLLLPRYLVSEPSACGASRQIPCFGLMVVSARVARWLGAVLGHDEALRSPSGPLRGQMDDVLARLVQFGVPEAHRVEALLATGSDARS